MNVYRIHSDALEQGATVYVDEKRKRNLVTDDGVIYTNNEIDILERSRNPIPKEVHIVKKVFQGMIVLVEQSYYRERRNMDSTGI